MKRKQSTTKYVGFILQELATLKQVPLKDESDSGSQSIAEEQSFLKVLYTVSEKATKLPKLNDDEYETKDVKNEGQSGLEKAKAAKLYNKRLDDAAKTKGEIPSSNADNNKPRFQEIASLVGHRKSTACNHHTIFRLPSTIHLVKDKFKIEVSKPFNTVDSRGNPRAVELLEQTTAHFIPLCACDDS
ncbi:uncharacterized protein RHIMIDRAFT_234044 [Rhizopus microsporus ATCC 52813]|uniref:Uncharacterized protein n=2 Tax=Rhizopus microsporus TaxID=58291 RepID=A0A2G4T602_RHIZD|nr:uncharacterized protein RHIMIDRAFT_234044 [Rhizopus microsporus ATCC 52813]PHZ16445.1 hypothetical protein RHIMIDRAFT_234044 [Rhizopus microsporus ATCC 52813]